jgi:hypothetical protein
MFGFIVWVGDGSDVGKKLIKSRGCQVCRSGEMLEQNPRHDIDPLVRALGRKDYSYQELKWIFVLQFRFGHRHVFRKMGDESLIALFFEHVMEKLQLGIQYS